MRRVRAHGGVLGFLDGGALFIGAAAGLDLQARGRLISLIVGSRVGVPISALSFELAQGPSTVAAPMQP